MTKQAKPRRIWYLVLVGSAVLAAVVVLVALSHPASPLSWLVRMAALAGYFFVFLSIVSSAYMRQLVRFFGRPFIQVHHSLSLTALAVIVLHPVGFALLSGTPRVFAPVFSTWRGFLETGGRPALYLLGLGALAAVLRRKVGRNWRIVHFLNYLAFWLATIHAILLGSSFQTLTMRILAGAMALIVAGVLIQRRRRTRSR